ncbi:hypothetical protein [Leptospira weilii]|uniref:Uncharacterized protein n=2 Tax=Leptospira weilii TaxID=28184 RepID=M6QGK1_9LEPT|nr:hypothetical protein [Leptospira weilii]EMM73443.1 hypothetical protein LEP1GSC038_2644 [Leptospira weilii str. 2006001855]EMN88082.1 hypothetical protein LEP1GSC108_0723 [Leptospira weilii str. UI 13098]OMI18557.1 hypothetical protein BUQ74_04045 [Leptospira weilii serovar Heyan]QDK25935.1 hypothetical protein FHG68_03845 [Leptospira weilii]ULH28158.1 hypothetical protein FH586_17660 [Leptospira weilii]
MQIGTAPPSIKILSLLISIELEKFQFLQNPRSLSDPLSNTDFEFVRLVCGSGICLTEFLLAGEELQSFAGVSTFKNPIPLFLQKNKSLSKTAYSHQICLFTIRCGTINSLIQMFNLLVKQRI